MVEFKSVVNNKIGLHLRAAGEFVKVATQFKSEITVIKNSRKANGKSILGLASLAIGKGEAVTIQIEGIDEKEAQEAVAKLIENKFYED